MSDEKKPVLEVGGERLVVPKEFLCVNGEFFEIINRKLADIDQYELQLSGPEVQTNVRNGQVFTVKPIDPPTLPASPEERDVERVEALEKVASAAEEVCKANQTFQVEGHHFDIPVGFVSLPVKLQGDLAAALKDLADLTREVERERYVTDGVFVRDTIDVMDAIVFRAADQGESRKAAAALNQLHSETSEGKA